MGRVRAEGGEVDLAAAGEAIARLAVLLTAGATAEQAWRHLAESGDPTAQRVRARAARGVPLAEAIGEEGGAWRQVSAAWHVASTLGAPLAESLRRIADVLDEAQEARSEIRIALAEPRATSRLMSLLPLASLLLGAALGFDTVSVLVGSPLGWACVALGAMLVVAGARWTARMVHRAQPSSDHPGLHAELMAIGLSSGASVTRARESLAQAAPEVRADDGERGILELSARAGVPAADLLRAHAAAERRRFRTEGRIAIARLGTRLVLPLGVCTLPAFVLLGIVPLLLSILTTTPLTLATPLPDVRATLERPALTSSLL